MDLAAAAAWSIVVHRKSRRRKRTAIFIIATILSDRRSALEKYAESTFRDPR
jgi:hypothetical protein